jgi:hypothetical protein
MHCHASHNNQKWKMMRDTKKRSGGAAGAAGAAGAFGAAAAALYNPFAPQPPQPNGGADTVATDLTFFGTVYPAALFAPLMQHGGGVLLFNALKANAPLCNNQVGNSHAFNVNMTESQYMTIHARLATLQSAMGRNFDGVRHCFSYTANQEVQHHMGGYRKHHMPHVVVTGVRITLVPRLPTASDAFPDTFKDASRVGRVQCVCCKWWQPHYAQMPPASAVTMQTREAMKIKCQVQFNISSTVSLCINAFPHPHLAAAAVDGVAGARTACCTWSPTRPRRPRPLSPR